METKKTINSSVIREKKNTTKLLVKNSMKNIKLSKDQDSLVKNLNKLNQNYYAEIAVNKIH